MATLRCTMAGSFFGIVLPKVCYYNPTKVRVIIIRELIAIRNRKQDAFYYVVFIQAFRQSQGSPGYCMHADVSFWAVTSSCFAICFVEDEK